MTGGEIAQARAQSSFTTPGLRLAGVLALALTLTAIAIYIGADHTKSQSVAGLPLIFWVQIVTGLGALTISGWVWALRPRDLAPILFAASGLATLAFTYAGALGFTPAVEVTPDMQNLFGLINWFGASGFGMVMIALFIVYPVRLPHWLPIAAISTAFFGIWTLLYVFADIPDWANGDLVTTLEMVGICIGIAAQYVATRNKPAARAVLIWLGLSVLIGAGTFITLVAAPKALGLGSSFEEGFAFSSFLLIYIGMAAGLRRYRLFELGDWAFRILFYMFGALLLIAIDTALILFISVDPTPAFGLSLLAVAFIYLPLRDAFARRVLRRKRLSDDELFRAVIDVAFEQSRAERADAWKSLLTRLFDLLECKEDPAPASAVEVRDDGIALALPPVSDLPGLALRYPWSGRGLFSPRHVRTAEQLLDLLAHAEESRSAYDRGVATERSRIARDMHDNIGAQLLGALHSPEADRKDSMIRETLTDLRNIINNASGPLLSLDETLADLRAETAERLGAVGATLNWSIGQDLQATPSQATANAIRALVREAVSNVIKHAAATQFDVSLTREGGNATLTLRDNGAGFDLATVEAGNGLANMENRVVALGGALTIDAGAQGTTLTARFPLTALGAST